jgi:hypothetical protein
LDQSCRKPSLLPILFLFLFLFLCTRHLRNPSNPKQHRRQHSMVDFKPSHPHPPLVNLRMRLAAVGNRRG